MTEDHLIVDMKTKDRFRLVLLKVKFRERVVWAWKFLFGYTIIFNGVEWQ